MLIISFVSLLCILFLLGHIFSLRRELSLLKQTDDLFTEQKNESLNEKTPIETRELNEHDSETGTSLFEFIELPEEECPASFFSLSTKLNKISNVSAAQSIEELGNLFFVALDCICILDLNGNFVSVNNQWKALFGYGKQTLSHTSLFGYVHENDRVATKEFFLSLDHDSEVASFLNRFRTDTNSYKWLEWRLARIGNQIYAAARDITERKLNEDTLRNLVEVTVKTPSEGFFNSISEWLRRWLCADHCVICEITEHHSIRTVATASDWRFPLRIDCGEQDPLIDMTKQKGFCYYADNIDVICPDSSLVENHQIRGYAGISLYDKNNIVKGIICIFSRSVLTLPPLSHEIFQIIAIRASGEMEYLLSEARYSSILYTAIDGFAQLDTKGKFIDVNEAYCRLTGYSKQQLLDMSINDIESPENEPASMLRLEKLRSAVHDRFETRHRCLNGMLIDLEISITFLPIGTGRFVLFLRNIAERKKSEADIRDITERFTLATRAASMGIWDWDIENNVLVWNDQMFLLYGREKEPLITFDIWKDSLHPDDAQRTLTEIDLALKGLKEFDTEFRILLPDTTIKYVRAISNLYKDSTGKAIRLIGTNWDITSEKEIQREFRKAISDADRANRSKSEFIANMSHEIRTPLNAIIGFSELLETISTDFKQKQFVNSIITAGRSLLRIINDILDMSKIESGMMNVQFAPLDLLPILEEIKQIFTPRIEEKGLKMTFLIHPTLPAVLYLDEIRLRQVMLNLVGNAVKFTDSGYIKISAQPIGTFDAHQCTFDLSIQIEDTGIGIPEEEQNIIFEPFRQRAEQNGAKYGGTGLGLSISKKLTELMNGELSVSSTTSKGSTFTLKLFNVAYKPGAKNIQQPLVTQQNESVTFTRSLVLIADDIESNRMVIREHCINAGLEVVEADNGIDAVKVALQMRPQVILMDIRMPKMDGIEALKEIRCSDQIKSIPVIALSAATNIHEIQNESGLSFSLFLSKPVQRDSLLNALAQFIPLQAKKPPRRQSRENASLTPELKVRFRGEFLSKLQSFNGAIRTRSLRALTSELHAFTSKYRAKEIDVFALQLEKAIESFDIEKINSLLKKLTDLCT